MVLTISSFIDWVTSLVFLQSLKSWNFLKFSILYPIALPAWSVTGPIGWTTLLGFILYILWRELYSPIPSSKTFPPLIGEVRSSNFFTYCSAISSEPLTTSSVYAAILFTAACGNTFFDLDNHAGTIGIAPNALKPASK